METLKQPLGGDVGTSLHSTKHVSNESISVHANNAEAAMPGPAHPCIPHNPLTAYSDWQESHCASTLRGVSTVVLG